MLEWIIVQVQVDNTSIRGLTGKGSPQGGVLSPLLKHSLQLMQNVFKIIEDWCEEHSLSPNLDKMKLVLSIKKEAGSCQIIFSIGNRSNNIQCSQISGNYSR